MKNLVFQNTEYSSSLPVLSTLRSQNAILCGLREVHFPWEVNLHGNLYGRPPWMFHCNLHYDLLLTFLFWISNMSVFLKDNKGCHDGTKSRMYHNIMDA